MPGGPKDWGHLEFENTERLLDLHAEYGVPATFAVVGAAALPGEEPYHNPAQVRKIHAAGHEVASHSFHHDWLPGLRPADLLETLRASKDALEQCIGAPVNSFVPPYNQPFDYPKGMSISFAERREAGLHRTGLGDLCAALKETGYEFCRISYRSIAEKIRDIVTRKQKDSPASVEMIRGIRCTRMNAPGGFNAQAHRVMDLCAAQGGIVVVGGHPHSLHAGNTQDEQMLVPFLKHARELHRQGLLRLSLPRDIVGEVC
jgi:peptidoglycan/xylan/chitin deacetylase (PgdA/CDA1 family)